MPYIDPTWEVEQIRERRLQAVFPGHEKEGQPLMMAPCQLPAERQFDWQNYYNNQDDLDLDLTKLVVTQRPVAEPMDGELLDYEEELKSQDSAPVKKPTAESGDSSR